MIYRFNYKSIPFWEEDLEYTLVKIIDVLNYVGEYNYEKLISDSIKKWKSNKNQQKPVNFDKNTPRDIYETWIMVGGSKYTGQFLKGKTIKDGIGQMIYPDGSLFEGIFKDDDTVKGRYIFTNGTVYEGEMKNHKMHGMGTLKFKNKVLYKGEFENGVQCNKDLSFLSTFEINSNGSDDVPATAKAVQFAK